MRQPAFLDETLHGAGCPDFKVVNCLSALASIEPNKKKAYVEFGIIEFNTHSISLPQLCSVLCSLLREF
jgi:hypothetical protein